LPEEYLDIAEKTAHLTQTWPDQEINPLVTNGNYLLCIVVVDNTRSGSIKTALPDTAHPTLTMISGTSSRWTEW